MHTSNKTKQRIMDTAIDLFTEKGYDNVSIKDICSNMKFGRSTFYYHFKTKEQILSEYYRSESAYNTENMSWILAAPNNLERAFRIQLAYERHVSSLGSDDAIKHFITSSLLNSQGEYEASFDKVKQLLIPVIEQAQIAGEIKSKIPSNKLCDLALQIQSGIILQYFMTKEKKPREETLVESLKLLYQAD